MISRPLDLASRLQPRPRSGIAFFFVNAGLIILFFSIFGSRFVLAPGLGVDFQLPQVAGATSGAVRTSHVVTIVNAGQIFAGDGLRSPSQLQEWLLAQAATAKQPTLLILSSEGVPVSVIAEVAGFAAAAGFGVQVAATEVAPSTPR
jgi:biopolymer transport protein ExbD